MQITPDIKHMIVDDSMVDYTQPAATQVDKLTGMIGKLQRRFGGAGLGQVDNAVTTDTRSSMGSYGDASTPSSVPQMDSQSVNPVTKDSSSLSPPVTIANAFPAEAPVVINNDASVRSNTSSYSVVNEAITPRDGILVRAVSTD